MPAGEPLRSTWWTPDDDDPDRAARRAEERAYLEELRDYEQAAMAGPPTAGPEACGMTIAPHPHDHAPIPPAAPDPDDPTGRRRYEASPSPMVIRTVWCSHPSCDASGIDYRREDTYERIMAAGGYRCADHPHELERLEDRERLLELDDSPASKAAAQVNNEGGPRSPAVMAEADPGAGPANRDGTTHPGPADDLPRRTQRPAEADRPRDRGGRPAGGRTCERCGGTLPASAPTAARYCTNACRQAVYRRRRRNAQP